MNYELYLKYEASICIGLHGHWGNLCDHNWADIMYWANSENDDEVDDEYEGTKIGIITWVAYNQVLAKAHDVNMSDVRFFTLLKGNRKALFDLDYTNISQETIAEIGAASNPNFVLLTHFGISSEYRNKRLGEELLKGFIEQMKGKYGYIVIIHNEPAQFTENNDTEGFYEIRGVRLDDLETDAEKAQWKLNAFWQRCGFKQFKNYDNVFICNVDEAPIQ